MKTHTLDTAGTSEADSGKTENYTAASIRVLNHAEQADRFSFARAGDLAAQYTHVPRGFIERLLAACEMSGMEPEMAIHRYLVGDRAVEVTEEFVECFKEISRP